MHSSYMSFTLSFCPETIWNGQRRREENKENKEQERSKRKEKKEEITDDLTYGSFLYPDGKGVLRKNIQQRQRKVKETESRWKMRRWCNTGEEESYADI